MLKLILPSQAKVKSGSSFLSALMMFAMISIFVYPHLQILGESNTAHRVQSFSALVLYHFRQFTTALTVTVLSFIVLKGILGLKSKKLLVYRLWALLISAAVLAFNLDTYVLFDLSQKMDFTFSHGLLGYWNYTFYSHIALWLSAWFVMVGSFFLEGRHKSLFLYDFLKRFSNGVILFIPLGYGVLPLIFSLKSNSPLISNGSSFLFTLNIVFVVQTLFLIASLLWSLRQAGLTKGFVTQKLKAILIVTSAWFCTLLLVWAQVTLSLNHVRLPYYDTYSLSTRVFGFMVLVFPLMMLSILVYGLWRHHHKKSKLGEDEAAVSHDFGSARFASQGDLKKADFYNEAIGPLLGMDKDGFNLYSPLGNKLIISPPGGGKTTASSIPLLLSHDGPVFTLDVKGELWAVTASYRQETLKRQVVTIDPFNIRKLPSFTKGKSKALLQEYHINPFDWLPKDAQLLDRVMNAFAYSFLVRSDLHTSHFDENAKILIRGTMDYLIRGSSEKKSLPELFRLLSGSFEEHQGISEHMISLGGRAMAAANQIARVGVNERGSILSTTYRQIDWLGDSNISRILNESNFNLKDFLKGNMDIYVILPEDQIKEHGRLMRMMMALLMGQIIQADPSELPDKKMVFLLEELAQLGNYPDVEQCIEVLRARNVVVWSVFQTLSQIELFEKPDLFKSVPLKQIFATDDVETMEWVQALAGTKTILTKGKSEDKGKSRDFQQWFGGSISSSRGESIHETGVDLLPMNEIREMDEETQLVFYKNMPPIRCKKARYFMDEMLKRKASVNPLA